MKITNSPRLSYRLMDSNDAELFFQLDKDPAVMKFINGGTPSTKEQTLNEFIPRMEKYQNPEKGWGMWGVFLQSTNEFIGWVLTRPMYFFSENPEFDNLELGWRFFQSSWGKGYASEAAKHIKDQIASNKDYKAFSAIADEDNLGSIGVMKKIGMSYLKTYRHIDPLFECDVVYYQVKN